MSKKTIPVRLSLSSERYEIAASLFDDVYGDIADPLFLSPADEMMLGIFADPAEGARGDSAGDGYFVKPADPAVLRARATGEKCDAIEHIDIITEGAMTITKDKQGEAVRISYDETELTGMEGATSTITYRTDTPALVTMLRTGTVKTALTFRAHHRTICVYDTPYMPFQIAVHALCVDNRIGTALGGTLLLDYLLEIKGGVAERCTMRVTVTPAWNEENA